MLGKTSREERKPMLGPVAGWELTSKWRTSTSPVCGWAGSPEGEWPVSYHGTEKEFAEKIAGSQFKYLSGVVSTPDPKVVEKYAEINHFQGDLYKVIIQNRINMEDIICHFKFE